MSALLIKCLFLTVWFVHLDCEVFQDRPKIKTSDGDLILQPAEDKNIYLLPNGPKSKVFVGSVDLLAMNSSIPSSLPGPATNYDNGKYQSDISDILRRLDNLDMQGSSYTNNLQTNISTIWRRINRFNTRIRDLEAQISLMTRDACQPHPCKHGGTCLTLVGGYHCLCPSNWEGTDCDVDVNECRNFAGTDLGCQNGASCVNKPGSYECQCKTGWFGVHCTRKQKDCTGGNYEMCGHGTCVETGKSITCFCNQGWTQNDTSSPCFVDINECDASQGLHCSANPKVDCINTPGSFRCGPCPAGYEGDGFICSDIDECMTIPNGGCSPLVSCHNTIGSRICGNCPPGYVGDGVTCSWRGSCSVNRGGCHPSAQCINNQTSQTSPCVCPAGMTGDGIGPNGCYVSNGGNATQTCENNPCVHGRCHALRLGYTCICFDGYGGAHCNMPADRCAGNPCHNGGVCRQDSSLTRGFRCECLAQYTGDLCESHAQSCGGILDNEEGSLYYPLHNTTYTHDSRCAWVIRTVPEKVINVTFSKFNLEPNPDCNYDFLQIHDGRSSANQLIGRFCGTTFPNGGNIVSSHQYLYLWFRSDSSINKDGFALHWTSIPPVCGGEIDATKHGRISSPGSPGKYPPNRDCYWHLQTDFNKRIQLHFYELDIEAHPNCSFDYISIYDGEHNTDPLIAQYCNSTLPAPVHSVGSDILIHFHSDAYGAGNGFQISFAPAEGVPGCGGFHTTDRGEIVSPSFNGKYLHNLICDYKIQTSLDTKIRIKFVSFALERSFRCRYDSLKIYDGPSPDSRLYGKFCGNTYPKTPFVSSSNSLFIKFSSDYNIASDGFKITYESVCQHTIVGDSGVIKSPGYPNNYPSNRVCEYVIRTSPGKVIQLTFQDFDLEDNRYYNCRYDNVEIRDGPDVNATSMGKFCGGIEHIPPTKTSTHNYMYIRFSSDMSLSGTGFYANYTTVETNCGGIYRENTGLINYPTRNNGNYENNQRCIWILIAPEGSVIKLTWNRFDLEDMSDCGADYLEITELEDNNDNNVPRRYCGSTPPPALTTTTNRLMLKFNSDVSVRSTGFSVLYSFLDARMNCGGHFIKSHGYIYSPGWPGMYDRNRDCTWTITVPAGQQIMLNISQFDLEQPIGGSCDSGDFLEIKNGGSLNSPPVGKFCGSYKYKIVKSLGNTISLHFHSDSYLQGRGFKIEWDGTITGCGGTLTSAAGSISSPNYPQTYNDNAECFYKIITNHGSQIQIHFTDLDLERTLKCKDDFIEIFDGLTQNDPSLGKFCEMTPAANRIITSSNRVLIKFRSDIYLGSKGFYLNYNTVCSTNITGSYGIIESPDFPGNYPGDLNCLWTITVPKGHKINVTFTHFDVNPIFTRFPPPYGIIRGPFSTSYPIRRPSQRFTFSACSQDYLQIKQYPDSEFAAKLCGTTIPAAFTSKSNILQIKFVTSSFRPTTGFRLEWVRYGCGGFIQKSYGTLSSDKNALSDEEMECEWIIQGSEGKSISISFTEIYLTETKDCADDAIEIYSGPTKTSPLIVKLCSRKPSTIQSNSNIMLVRYVKKSNLRGAYFKSNFDAYRTGCGGRLESLSGTFSSKNYPQNYDTNTDCIWHITIPQYHRIELNFLDIDLYSTDDEDDCHDFIKIYEDGYIWSKNYSKLICPKSRDTQYISNTNRIAVQFISDGSMTSKGFKANFSMTCGALITAKSDGVITSDKYVNHSNRSCTWTLVAPNPDQKITLTVTHIAIPKNYDTVITNRNCPSSFLRILGGSDVNAPVIGEYCGNKVPPMIVSQGNALTVELGTYTNNITGLFSAHYTTLDNACGGSYTSEEGTIASPNYPLAYPGGADCEWILKTSPGNRVYITFEKFDLSFSEHCNEDYLELRENNGVGRLIGVYCGNTVPTKTTAASKIYIKFHSDNKNAGRGFLIHYGFLHGNEIAGLDRGEVSSPLYPSSYNGAGEYTWRIMTTDSSETLSLIVDRLEIHTFGTRCSNYLAIYDGYDESASILQELCGILQHGPIEIQTTKNVVYIKLKLDNFNTGSLFHIRWAKTDRSGETEEEIEHINCGSNVTEVILPGKTATIHSPNYPDPYDDDLMCEWVYKSSPGYHISLNIENIELEERPNCFADYISVFSSDTGLKWKPVKEFICTTEAAQNLNIDTTFTKLVFKSDYSMAEKGFSAVVSSKCGGRISETSGEIGITWRESQGFNVNCQWQIKVRPGRVIKLKFVQFNITNKENECYKYVTLRNGDSKEAPLLGSGKYCGYSHENRVDLETSSNALFVAFDTIRNQGQVQTFRLHYEEKGIECGVTSKLDTDHSSEVFMTPNYPSIPQPYSECVWIFSGPVGEILRVDFLDFDLAYDTDCIKEAIEVRDGASSLAPLKGRFCYDKPGSIKSTGNSLYLRYVTQKEMPNRGLKANVSIDVCGGSIFAINGEVSSPGYPHLPPLKEGTVCEWRITGYPGHVFQLKPQMIDLPESEVLCATKIVIKDGIGNNNTIITFCNEDTDDIYNAIETSSNEVIIQYYVGKKSNYHSLDTKGFRFTFNASRPMCGGTVTTPDGYIMTPGYPRKTTMHYCYWFITVPDISRRIRLEVEDYDLTDTYRIGIYNDRHFQTLIQSITNKDFNLNNRVFESSGNTLAIYIWMSPLSSEHNRFKAKFSSSELALCGGTLTGNSGEISSPAMDRSYYCRWIYRGGIRNEDDDANVNNTGGTLFINAKINSSIARTQCRYSDPKLSVNAVMADKSVRFNKLLCGNDELQLRIPSDGMDLTAIQTKGTSLNFHLDWKLQPCGGIINVGEEAVNVLNVPNNYNGSLDCAWIISVPTANRIKLKLDGLFKLSCSDEFVKISVGSDTYQPPIGDYCRDKMQTTELVVSFREIYIQYHSNDKSGMSIKLMAATVNHQCGGYLSRFSRTFTSPNYGKNYIENQECAWEIEADLGNRVSLQFVDRFVIEETPNCTKDMVIIYDWFEESYTEMARVCGRNLPPIYNSTNNKMKVVLRTDSDTNLDGFKARWTPICGGKYKAKDKEQTLFSPGYPGEYTSLLDCMYEIFAPGEKIAIKFIDFELEGTYPDCSYDNFTIAGYGMNYYEPEAYCGTEMPTPGRYRDRVFIHFKTDRYIQRKGFKLTYSFYSCGGRVTEPTVITSGEGFNYERDMNCTWLIESPANKIVIVKFITMKIEGRSCSYDYIELFNGHNIDYDTRIVKTCGFLRNENPVFRSTGNKMLLHFVTDGSVNYEGFKVGIFFSYSESVGCGGHINLTQTLTQTITSPLINGSTVYENFLDCQWIVRAADDRVIKAEFISFHVSPCKNVNQTAFGYSKCDCDHVQMIDGVNPDSVKIGVYCGHTIPPVQISSGNVMSIRLSTDGEINSSGFQVRLTAIPNVCGQSEYSLSSEKIVLHSPGYQTGTVPRGLNCIYEITPLESFSSIHIRINNLDLQPSDPDKNLCTTDRLTVSGRNIPRNLSIGADYIHEHGSSDIFEVPYFYEESITVPKELQICGVVSSVDYFLYGNAIINLHTSPNSDSKQHKGFEIEIEFVDFCGRNHTEPQGRVRAIRHDREAAHKDCYTLITAPDNYTVSAYFISVNPDYYNEEVYLQIFDGDKTSSKSLAKITEEYDSTLSVFSTGRYMLIHNHQKDGDRVGYEFNYVTTNKGPGCGGKLLNEFGQVSSPLYPNTYRQTNTCEWELETPVGTKLALRFSTFDLGNACDKNYVKLVKRNGDVVSTYCEEIPAIFTSEDNYVKIVFATDLNNGGTGWVAQFIGVV